MALSQTELAKKVLATARAMNASGINRGSAGNVSARCDGGFLITPTGMAYDACAPDDMVTVGMDGTSRGRRKPSSEWRFHRDIYLARPEAGAVVHTHSPFATALACQEQGIPAFHYMVARFGGDDLRCAAYATFGTQELSDAIVIALQGAQCLPDGSSWHGGVRPRLRPCPGPGSGTGNPVRAVLARAAAGCAEAARRGRNAARAGEIRDLRPAGLRHLPQAAW
jgi:hypothetical protein